jgi:hypothetical protein
VSRAQKTATGADAVTASRSAGVAPDGVVPRTVADILPVGLFMTADHRYYSNGEGPVPSVTTIIDVMSKPAVVTWKAKESAKAMLRLLQAMTEEGDGIMPAFAAGAEDDLILQALKESDAARDTAASIGTGVHLLADMASRGQESDSKGWQVSAVEEPYLAAFRTFLGRYSASSIVSSEKAVWSLNGYAGTYDLLMFFDCEPCRSRTEYISEEWQCGERELWLLDIKTSKGIYPEYGLQLAAYRWADYIIVEGDPTRYPMPEVKRTGVLHLRPDKYPGDGFRLQEYDTDYQLDYIPFLGLLEAYQWREAKRHNHRR